MDQQPASSIQTSTVPNTASQSSAASFNFGSSLSSLQQPLSSSQKSVAEPLDLSIKSSREERKMQRERCIRSLVHAFYCPDVNCLFPSCLKMKRIVLHTRSCQRKLNGSCPVCKQLIALCCYHAKDCWETNCLVPICLNIRPKLNRLERLQGNKLAENQMASSGTGTLGVNGASEGSDGQQLEGATGFAEPQEDGQCVGRQNAQQPKKPTNMMDAQQQHSFSAMTQGAMGGHDANKTVPDSARLDGQGQLPRSLHQLRKAAKPTCKHQLKLQEISQILRSDPKLLADYTKQRFNLRQNQQQDRNASSNPSQPGQELSSTIPSVSAVDRPASSSSVPPLNNQPLVIISDYAWKTLIKEEQMDED